MTKQGKLYLLPVPVSEADQGQHIPAYNMQVIMGLKYFIAEDAKTARRHLKLLGYGHLPSAEIMLLNEHTKSGELGGMLGPIMDGNDMGLMSDAGCPGIADPGAEVVRIAHKKGIRVVPLTGPSSIVLSIMSSGFNGQNFAFIGYLPVDKAARQKRIKDLELLAARQGQAQFFIETPYRNDHLFDDLLLLAPDTMLFIGKDLTSPNEYVASRSISEWKRTNRPALHKVPVVFGIFK